MSSLISHNLQIICLVENTGQVFCFGSRGILKHKKMSFSSTIFLTIFYVYYTRIIQIMTSQRTGLQNNNFLNTNLPINFIENHVSLSYFLTNEIKLDMIKNGTSQWNNVYFLIKLRNFLSNSLVVADIC